MSTNIHFVGRREISFKKKNSEICSEIQTNYFSDVFQTKTEETKVIICSDDPKQAYIDLVKTYSCIEKIPQYEDDDIFGESIIGYTDYDWTVEHINKFNEWWNSSEEFGYVITPEAY